MEPYYDDEHREPPDPPWSEQVATGDWMNDHPRIRLTPGPGKAGVR